MKNFAKLLAGILLASNFIACTSQSGKAPKLSNNMDSVSYAIGVWIASGPANVPDKSQINLKLVQKAMADYFAGNDSVFSRQELQNILQKFSMDQQQKQAEVDKIEDEKRINEGKDFLAKNKEKAGVVETASGLQYKVIKEGSGRQPHDSSFVKVNYKGTLLNGKVFDSSYDRGEPAQFRLDQVIRGWTEGLQLMKEGSVYEFYIPSELGYGNRAMSEDLKANSTLIFEVELLEVMAEE
ncbi:MAG: FKBP-type peptidyl-prolyl cis-trans isomerase [Bacteroidales bacterium]|nr:FKBP-type peptidyl-prolyl cis-trans isomerase [Bacteroidales bacterium]